MPHPSLRALVKEREKNRRKSGVEKWQISSTTEMETRGKSERKKEREISLLLLNNNRGGGEEGTPEAPMVLKAGDHGVSSDRRGGRGGKLWGETTDQAHPVSPKGEGGSRGRQRKREHHSSFFSE